MHILRRSSIASITIAGLVMLLALSSALTRPADAEETTFVVPLSGMREIPAVDGPGHGVATFTFDDETNELEYHVSLQGIARGAVTAAHIHLGAIDENGPVVHFLSADPFLTASGTIELSGEDVAILEAGNFYVNAHSVINPGGFARGQMLMSAEDVLRADVQGTVDAWNNQDAVRFAGGFTDAGLFQDFELERETAVEDLEMFIGSDPIELRELRDIKIQGTRATAFVELAIGTSIEAFEQNFVLEGGIWLLDTSTTASPTLEPDTRLVDMELDEFSFNYDKDAVASGDFAFDVENVGEQPHEIVITKIGDLALDDLVDELLAGGPDAPPPAGVEFVAFGGFFEPGASGATALAEPLSSGRYALLCFVPDPADGVPHVAKGMISDFTVDGADGGADGGNGITPPSTGDGGLRDAMAPMGSTAVFAVAAGLFGLGLAGLAVSRRAA